VTSLAGGTIARLQRKPYQEWKSQFSYQKYNHAPLRLQAAPPPGFLALSFSVTVQQLMITAKQVGLTILESLLYRVNKVIR
jgi:hypothetical protein